LLELLIHFSISILAVTAEKVTEVEKKFSQVKLTWFFYGNLLPEESLKIAQTFELNIKRIFGAKPISPSQVELINGVVMIPEGKDNVTLYQLTSVKQIINTFRF